MSFITRCPTCGTAFRVVPDQLKISEGWVRCGQCQHVFDATLDLQPWWPGATEAAVSAAPEAVFAPTQIGPAGEAAVLDEPSSAIEPTAVAVVHGPTEEHQGAGHAPVLMTEVPPEEAPTAPQSELNPPVPESDLMLDQMALGTLETAPNPVEASPEPETPVPIASVSSESILVAEMEDAAFRPSPLTFVRQAERRAVWRHPLVLALLGISTVLWGLVLLGQMVFLWRDTLAVRMPVLKPVLQTFCQPFGCQVCAPRQIDRVSIDSSNLRRNAPDQYTFEMVLKNTAPQAVLTPALELTLTDMADRVLLRRVIPPEGWPQPLTTLPPASEHTVRLDWQVPDELAQSLSGYRALLFYP